MSKAYTKKEVRKMVLDHIENLCEHWANTGNDGQFHSRSMTVKERCEGVAFSLLVMLDGESDLPHFDVVLRPCPEDKEYFESKGEKYFEDGMVINDDCYLHDEGLPDELMNE